MSWNRRISRAVAKNAKSSKLRREPLARCGESKQHPLRAHSTSSICVASRVIDRRYFLASGTFSKNSIKVASLSSAIEQHMERNAIGVAIFLNVALTRRRLHRSRARRDGDENIKRKSSTGKW